MIRSQSSSPFLLMSFGTGRGGGVTRSAASSTGAGASVATDFSSSGSFESETVILITSGRAARRVDRFTRPARPPNSETRHGRRDSPVWRIVFGYIDQSSQRPEPAQLHPRGHGQKLIAAGARPGNRRAWRNAAASP